MAALDAIVSIRRLRPLLIGDDRIAESAEKSRVFDWICHRGQMNVRLALLYEVHGGGDIVDLFTGISPHQEHTHLNSIALRRIGGPDDLIDFDAPLHSVEDALAAALGTDPDSITTHIGKG